MNDFKVTLDRRVFIDDIEIRGVHGFDVVINSMNDPEVVLRLTCGSVSIEEYTELFRSKKEPKER